jgi:hypothetical protein
MKTDKKGIIVLTVPFSVKPTEFRKYIKTQVPEYVEVLIVPANEGRTKVEYISLDGTNFDVESVEGFMQDEKEELVNLRVTKLEKALLQEKSERLGFKSLSDYLRVTALNAILTVS